MKNTLVMIPLGLALATPLLQADDDWDINRVDVSKLPPAADKQDVTYAQDIRPMFEASCFRCHGDEKQKGRLRLDSLEAVLKGGEDGKVVVPGDSKKSLLAAAAARIDDDIAMPPEHKPGRRGPGEAGAPANEPPGGHREASKGEPDRRGGPEGGRGGPPPKPLTADQVGLIRAWIDQGAK